MPETSDGKYTLSVLALIFPPLSQAEFQAMVQSIRERGLQKPVILWRGQIIDGRHRYEACLQAGVEPHFQELPEDSNPFDRVLDENVARRHMNESQRAIAAHRLWEGSSGGWTGLGLPDGGANLHRFSLQEAANRFNVSRRLVAHAGRVVGRDSRAVPELKLAAEQGTVSVSDASKAVNQAPDIQMRALELMRSGRSRTIAGAAKRAVQEAQDRQLEGGPGVILPEQPAAGITLHHSTVGDLHQLVGREDVDAIITFPPSSEQFLAMLPDLASFAAHSLKPSGVMVMMANVENLPEVFEHLRHPELRWVCEFDYLFDAPPSRLQGKHRLNLRRRPLLVFGKPRFWLNGGDDLVRVDRPEDTSGWSHSLEAGMRLIVQRFATPGQVVCDPIMLDRDTIALAAVGEGCRFIGADRDRSCIDRALGRLAKAGIVATHPRNMDGGVHLASGG